MSERRKFTVSLLKDPDSGWVAAQCVELPAAISQGKTEAEAMKNIREAIELVLKERMENASKTRSKLVELTINA